MRRFRRPLRTSVKKADPVTTEVRDLVLWRDGGCVASILERDHECRDMYGMPHRPDALWRLTLEHVKDDLRLGRRAPSDPEHLVALCYGANVGVPSKELRAALRGYLKRVAGETDHSAHVDPCPGCPRRVA